MTKNEIIEKIYREDIDKLLTNLKIPEYNQDDTKQMVMLSLLKKDDDKIIELFENKQINFFLVKLIKNLYYSKNGEFYQTYQKYYEKLDRFKNKNKNEIDNEIDEEN